jgi:hypothetical protein
MVYHDLKRKPEALAMLNRLKAGQGEDGAYQYAQIYAKWGDTKQALQWLARAAALHDPGLLAIKTDPFLSSIRETSEFRKLVLSLNLPS